jgi:formylglycine-generating enzyme required for sulfatase activity/subtilisin-like proprotein convertase family protein
MKLHIAALPAFFASTALLIGVAHADPPGQVCSQVHEFFVTESDGSPSTGTVDVELRYFRAGVVAPSECRTFDSVPLDRGWARITVDACALPADDAFCGTTTINALLTASAAAGTPLSVGAWVDDEEITPRFSLGAAPFAAYANVAGESAFADECSTLGGYGADDFILASMPLDADTLDGLDSSAFLGAGDPIDADSLGGMSLSEILDMIGEGGGGGDSPVGTRLTETFESLDVPLTASTTTVTIDKDVPVDGTIESVVIHLQITHANTTEISRARLFSPSGTAIDLHSSRAGVNINCSYPTTCTCTGTACTEAFIGENPRGLWSLELRDAVSGNPIVVTRFALEIRYRNPGVIADLPSTFTVGGSRVQLNTLGGTGELGDLVVLPSEVRPLMPFSPYHYRNVIVHPGGRLVGLYEGDVHLFATENVVIAGEIDLNGHGFLGGTGGGAESGSSGGAGGAGGGGIYVEAGRSIVFMESSIIRARGANGASGRTATSSPSTEIPGQTGRDGTSIDAASAGAGGEGGITSAGGKGGGGGGLGTAMPLYRGLGHTRQAQARNSTAPPTQLAGGGGGGGGSGANSMGRTGGGGGAGGGGGGSAMLVAGDSVQFSGSMELEGGTGGAGGAGRSSGGGGLPGQGGSRGVLMVFDESGERICTDQLCDSQSVLVGPGTVSRRFSSTTTRTYTTSRFTSVNAFEITAGDWLRVTGANRATGCGNDCPVNADWFATLAFANALSIANGLEPCFLLAPPSCADSVGDWSSGVSTCTGATFEGIACTGFRPPTSAEWEIMYRGESGSTSGTYLGNVSSSDGICAPDPTSDLLGWYCANSGGGVRAVGGRAPNRDGVFDLFGNVAEWTLDEALSVGPGVDQVSFDTSSGRTNSRVACGGSTSSLARDANTGCSGSFGASSMQGIRLVRTLP